MTEAVRPFTQLSENGSSKGWGVDLADVRVHLAEPGTLARATALGRHVSLPPGDGDPATPRGFRRWPTSWSMWYSRPGRPVVPYTHA